MTPLYFVLAGFASTILGGMFGIRNKDRLHLIISFTAGVLIAVCFFDIVPEIFATAQEHGFDTTPALLAIVIGFLTFHTVEKAALIHTAHEHEYASHKHPLVGYVSALGLATHSFLDGMGIGLGFHVSMNTGIVIALAVITHAFSDGINTVSLMLLNRHTVRKAVMLLGIVAFAPIVGLTLTYFFTIPNYWLMLYLGFFAGFLLYIGASDLLPEAHSSKSSFKLIGLTILGAAFIFVVTRFV